MDAFDWMMLITLATVWGGSFLFNAILVAELPVITIVAIRVTVAALALAPDAVGLDELSADPPERLALVLGTEGDGLARRTLGQVDLTDALRCAAVHESAHKQNGDQYEDKPPDA